MITIMGATGHTGRQIAAAALKGGEKVRALGRSENKLAELKRSGAEVQIGDVADATFLTQAFRGADAVYTLLPTGREEHDYFGRQKLESEAIAKAIASSGVRYVVALSSIGADLPEGTGLIRGLHEKEECLRRLSGINVLVLRPASFFENFYAQLDLIKNQGILSDSIDPDLVLPMIATRDIAHVASHALKARDWKGLTVRELHGQRSLTHPEATRILGERLGKPDLRYVQISYADMATALREAGFSRSFADLYVQMTRAFNKGAIKPQEARTAQNTTPTRFEEFAAELAHAYQAAA